MRLSSQTETLCVFFPHRASHGTSPPVQKPSPFAPSLSNRTSALPTPIPLPSPTFALHSAQHSSGTLRAGRRPEWRVSRGIPRQRRGAAPHGLRIHSGLASQRPCTRRAVMMVHPTSHLFHGVGNSCKGCTVPPVAQQRPYAAKLRENPLLAFAG
ncbi:hypothetical protein VC83_00424 [Pseudogymnoascus destructans]|uniref:Uncharacterized protein n=1 Tax=Pseudogymnoascus destructans TaxID=655981 RepID=A0A177AN35_9PEZI|nr:uncharacterized protein VC83_00424 [Pseudogymnoascus destructans]OAF63487.1 hypothetical protein VC83_00424 [Pseudogymnoascus destructans]